MEVLNYLPKKELEDYEDFLAFVGIYDDKRRIRAYVSWLRRLEGFIKDKVCVEAGAGFGVFARELLRLGARKVYAIEENPLMLRLLKKWFSSEDRVVIIDGRVENFVPDEGRVDFMVQEFYGPLLYDESLFVLERLPFPVGYLFPNGGRLLFGYAWREDYADASITLDVIEQLNGVLVADLFPRYYQSFEGVALEWNWSDGLLGDSVQIDPSRGDLLVFGVELLHSGRRVCRAGWCTNWPIVWTPVAGLSFEFDFVEKDGIMIPIFQWAC